MPPRGSTTTANLQTAQVLNVDLYDHEAAAPVLDSAAFYAACRGTLAHGGVMTVNLFGRAASFERSAGAHRRRVRPRPGLEPAARPAKATRWWWPHAAWPCPTATS